MPDTRVLLLDDLPRCGLAEFFVLTAADEGQTVELRRTSRGAIAVPAYSSLRSLVACCGWGQPWVITRPERLEAVARAAGATEVTVDMPIPDDHTYTGQPAHDELEELSLTPDIDVLYIPSRPFRRGQSQARLELQLDKAGRRMLLAYSSAAALAQGCGPYQPWVAVPVDRLPKVTREAGADVVVFDRRLVDEARYGGPVRDWLVARTAGRDDEEERFGW